MPEKSGRFKCKKIGLSNADVLAKYHKLGPDSIRLNNCKTYAEQQLEVCKIANEIMAMQDPKHRLDRLVALRGDKQLVNVHHTMVVDKIQKLEARMKHTKWSVGETVNTYGADLRKKLKTIDTSILINRLVRFRNEKKRLKALGNIKSENPELYAEIKEQVSLKCKAYSDKCVTTRTKLIHKRKATGCCSYCGLPLDTTSKTRCSKCKERYKYIVDNNPNYALSQRKSRAKLKLQIMDAYGGPVCKCCGERRIEFLSIDHINNDGAAHRRAISKNGIRGGSLYLWLRQHKFPPGFQVLCMNCNFAKGKHGYCPHEKERSKNVKFKNPSGQVGSKQPAGAKDKRGAGSRGRQGKGSSTHRCADLDDLSHSPHCRSCD